MQKEAETRVEERQKTGFFAEHTYDDDDEPIVLEQDFTHEFQGF